MGPPRRGGGWTAGGSAVPLALLIVVASVVPGGVAAVAPRPASTAVHEYVNVTATSSLSFVPSSISVKPGAIVYLNVTQEASFAHTFTLSSVRNQTIPPSDTAQQLDVYLHDHPPLVNLSLGSTRNAKFPATFTAPLAGTYEFLCIVHWPGMTGVLTSTNGSGPPSGVRTIPPVYAETGVGLVLVVLVAAWILLRRRGGGPVTVPPDQL